MNRGHVSKRTNVTWNTAAARLAFALEGGRQLPGAFLRAFPRLHAQVRQDRGGSLLKPVLLTGLFIFPNSWKFCKSCFCPLLFKYFCFWQKGKWKSIFKCILHFFCCFPLCSPLGADNELTDVLSSPGSLSSRGTHAAARRLGRALSPTEGPACPSSASSQLGGPSQRAHRTRQDLASPSTLHLRHLCCGFAPKHTRGRGGFSLSPLPTVSPLLPLDGLPGLFGQGAGLVVGQEWAHGTGWASSPSDPVPAGEGEAAEEWLEAWRRPTLAPSAATWEETPHGGREETEPSNTSHHYCPALGCKEETLNNPDFKCFKFPHSKSVVFSMLTHGLVTDCGSGDGLSKLCN